MDGAQLHFLAPRTPLAGPHLQRHAGVPKAAKKGLESQPKLMLIGDPDAQARWYLDLKKQWQLAQQTGKEFVNSIAPSTLRWVT
jgi:hypothetical protein